MIRIREKIIWFFKISFKNTSKTLKERRHGLYKRRDHKDLKWRKRTHRHTHSQDTRQTGLPMAVNSPTHHSLLGHSTLYIMKFTFSLWRRQTGIQMASTRQEHGLILHHQLTNPHQKRQAYSTTNRASSASQMEAHFPPLLEHFTLYMVQFSFLLHKIGLHLTSRAHNSTPQTPS